MKLFLLIIMSLSFLQCSDTGGNNDMKVYLAPNQPTVFLSNITVTTADGEEVISKPWIRFQMKAENLTGETLYIVGLRFVVTYTNNGTIEEKEYTYEPGDFLDVNGDPRTLFIAEVAANSEWDPEINFYLSSLPNAEENEADSFIFSITGYFEAYTGSNVFEPNRNIRHKFVFTTQQPVY